MKLFSKKPPAEPTYKLIAPFRMDFVWPDGTSLCLEQAKNADLGTANAVLEADLAILIELGHVEQIDT